jgi:hypothetical protein
MNKDYEHEPPEQEQTKRRDALELKVTRHGVTETMVPETYHELIKRLRKNS